MNVKTPSQRLRNVIYILYTQTDQKDDFEVFYRRKVEELIDIIKSKII